MLQMFKECSRRDFMKKSILSGLTAGAVIYGLEKIVTSPDKALAADYVPTALNAHEYATVVAVADRIIPEECQTPGGNKVNAGATMANVGRFIDSALGDVYDYKQSSQLSAYQAGVANLDAASNSVYAMTFVNLTETQKDAILTGCDDSVYGASLKSFFTLINMHTWEGFLSLPKYGGNTNFKGWDAIGYVSNPMMDDIFETNGGCYQCHDFGNPNTLEHWLIAKGL